MVKWLELAQDKMVSLWTCIIPTSPHHCFPSVCADRVLFRSSCSHAYRRAQPQWYHRARLQELGPPRAAVRAGMMEHNPQELVFSFSPVGPWDGTQVYALQQVPLSDCNSVLSDSSVKVRLVCPTPLKSRKLYTEGGSMYFLDL